MMKHLYRTAFVLTVVLFAFVVGLAPRGAATAQPETNKVSRTSERGLTPAARPVVCTQRIGTSTSYTSDHCLFTMTNQEWSVSRPRQADPVSLDNADLNVAYIMQLPRYDYSATKKQHAPGDSMTFVGHIANRGSQATGPFDFKWSIDGTVISSGTAPNLAASEMTTLTLGWVWQAGPHTVRLTLDPADSIAEVSEQNNFVEDRTNALGVGFWVEESVYDWFNVHQGELGLGSVSWDDWAQRQLRYWNEMFATAVHPLTPQGILERVRLDKVVIIPDGTWEDCANWPNPEDQTVDLVWGFPSELVGVDSGRHCPPFNFYIVNPQFQEYEPALLHEMSHARYLIDLYGLNLYTNAAYLESAVNATSSALMTDRNVEQDGNFPVPAFLAVDGELIVCQSKDGNAFTQCARGSEGTTPRAHAVDTGVHLATVRVQDGHGNLVQGSAALPVVGDWNDHLYFNRYPNDLMSGGLEYSQHSAYAWNRIVGQRPVCGNYNAPCNIGEYLNDIPENNVLEVVDLDGHPIAGARVTVYQPEPFPLWYGRYFDASGDIVAYTDAQGRASIGGFPFGEQGSIVHTFGQSNALLLLGITSGPQTVYRFFEVTETNEAYWSGYEDMALYTITVDLPHVQPPLMLFLPTVMYLSVPTEEQLLELSFEGTLNGADGEVGTGSNVAFVTGHAGQGAFFGEHSMLHYQSADNINLPAGSIEFWLNPTWNGNDGKSYVFFEIGDSWFNRMRIMKDGANNFRFMVWSEDTEYDAARNISHWQANEWHHVRVTWQESEIALYLDGTLQNRESGIALPSHLASTLHLASTAGGDLSAQAILDEFIVTDAP